MGLRRCALVVVLVLAGAGCTAARPTLDPAVAPPPPGVTPTEEPLTIGGTDADGVRYRIQPDSPNEYPAPELRLVDGGLALAVRWNPFACPQDPVITVEDTAAGVVQATVRDTVGAEPGCPAVPHESLLRIERPGGGAEDYAVLIDDTGLVVDWEWAPFDGETGAPLVEATHIEVFWEDSGCSVSVGAQLVPGSPPALAVDPGSVEPATDCTEPTNYRLRIELSEPLEPTVTVL